MFMFEKLCRLCITDKGVSSTLNNSDSDNIILLDKLNLIAPELLQINSSLPIGICTTCIVQLNQACKFLKTCSRSQEILNKYLEQLQNGFYVEQDKKYEIVINEIRLEQNNAINYMNDMQIELTDQVNYELVKLDFIKQENIIEYNDGSEATPINFEDDIIVEEETDMKQFCTNVKMEIANECLSKDIIDIKNEIIETDINEVKFEDGIEIEDHDIKYSCIDISTISGQSDLYGFNSTEYSLANDIKVKYNFELDHLCEDTNKFLIDFRNEINNTTNSENLKNDKNVKNNVANLKKVPKNQSDITRQILKGTGGTGSGNSSVLKSHICKTCTKAFARKGDLMRHNRMHTGEKPFQCKMCTKAFARKFDVTDHMLTHTGEKRFSCISCTKAFARKSDLKKHILIHTGEKPFQCKTCTKAFTRTSDLTKHYLTHTGEKPYQCKTCTRAFAHKSSLTSHIRTHTATREKPYECETCEKAFTRKSHLTIHIRTHTAPGKKPYKCETCKKAFAHKSTLTRHIRSEMHTHNT